MTRHTREGKFHSLYRMLLCYNFELVGNCRMKSDIWRKTMKQKRFRTLLLAAALLLGTLQPAMQANAAAYEFRAGAGGKQYWYENGVKQGTTSDTLGIMGDGTNRGREIYDPNTNEWYWLDSCYDGAKAEGKEVWIPYIYQEELTTAPGGNGRIANGISSESKIKELAAASVTDEADMSAQVEASIRNRTGKWVRYDENGAMIKGWCVITGKLADCYKDQEGNRYYYDQKTGLMAKGDVTIGGKTYHFDETSGVCTNYDEVNSRSATSTNNWALSAQEEEVYRKIIALKDSAYPEGMTWTNKDCYVSMARGSDYGVATKGYGCHGFALAASDAAFGDAPIHFLKNPNQIRVGDILRINNNSHTVIAIGFDATGITIAEGNYNSSIHWGRKLAWSVLDTCNYIHARYSDNWEGTKRLTAEHT